MFFNIFVFVNKIVVVKIFVIILNKGADCTIEKFLNFNGGTDNGFSPYNLVYHLVEPSGKLRTFLENRSDIELVENINEYVISIDELAEIDPELVPLGRNNFVTDCNEAYRNPVTGESENACSCTDCDPACPAEFKKTKYTNLVKFLQT